MRKSRKHQPTKTTAPKPDECLPFIEHLYELRRRLFYIAISVVAFCVAGYFIQQHLVAFLLKPSHGQQFIYTSPLGGLNFLFQVCIYFGLVLSIPVIIFQLLKYLEPLIRDSSRSLIVKYSVASVLLAVSGGAFGYYLGLPVALRFLSQQFVTSQIRPLLTIQEYMNFVTIYLLGSALLFQLPLIILFINRVKPFQPRQLLHFERYMLLIAFVAAAIMTPTTDIFDQLIFALPIMLMYQVALVLIYFQNRRLHRRRSPEVQRLMALDAKVREERERLMRRTPVAPVAAAARPKVAAGTVTDLSKARPMPAQAVTRHGNSGLRLTAT